MTDFLRSELARRAARDRAHAERAQQRHEDAVAGARPAAPRGETGRFQRRGSGAQALTDEIRRRMGHVVESEAGPGAPAAPPAGSRARPLPGGAATHHSGEAGPTSAEVSQDIVRQIRSGRRRGGAG